MSDPRIQRIINDNGGEVDYKRLEKYAEKLQ